MLSHYLGVNPHVLLLAKSLTLGKEAGSAAILNAEFAEKAFPPGVDGGTFSGNPAVSDIIIKADTFWHESDHLDTLFDYGTQRKEKLEKALHERPNEHIVGIKGIGAMAGIEFKTPEAARHYHNLLVNLGEHIRACKDPTAPILPDEKFKGILQKLSGKSGQVMRMTTGLAEEHHQNKINQLLKYALTAPHFKPQQLDSRSKHSIDRM
jgi:acetylornithine/succinyldiaminopimelate/putrescine aminotransferase